MSVADTAHPGFAPHLSTGRTRAAFLGAFWSLFHTVLPSLSAALVFFVSAAFLAPADFGQLAIAAGIVSIALAVSPAAFGEALVQREHLAPGHADAVFWLNAGLAALYTAGLVVAAPGIAAWFDIAELGWILPLLALKVPFELLAAVPSAMIVRAMAFRLLALRTAIGTGVGLILAVALLLLGHGILSLVVSQIAVSATTFAVAFRTARWRPGLSGRPSHIRELARYGLFASGQRLLTMVRADHLLLGALGGAALLGLLVFAQRIFALLSSLAGGALSTVSHVVFSSMQNEPAKARHAFLLVTFAAAGVGFPAFAGTALVIDDVVSAWFADDWTAALPAAQLICLAGVIATLGIVQSAVVRGRGHADWMFWYQLAQEASTLLAIALAYRYGLEAVVLAIVAKTALIWPVSVAMCLRLLACPLADYVRAFAGPAMATLAMAGVLCALPALPGATGIALQIAVGVAVYALALAAFAARRLREVWRLARRKEENAP